jgi:sulfatase maturation enzyme AslB (radical SAM superfamily)
MKPITISLNPTYLCNFRCDFCYLTPEQLADNKKLDPAVLASLVEDMRQNGYQVDHVDLYGGEIGLLTPTYLEKLDEILNTNAEPTVNVITNLSRINSYFLHDYVDLSVSYDFKARQNHQEVFHNIAKLGKDVAVLMLASPELLKENVDEMIVMLNSLQNVKSVEIKPYSANQANMLNVTDKDFEEFVKRWMLSPVEMNFSFINAQRIKDSLDGSYTAYSDSHVYITPAGKYSVLEFDESGNEFFLELDTFKEYLDWTEVERKRVGENAICKACPYLGRCLTEHYRDVKSLDDSCNGFRLLLDWSLEHQSLVEQMAQ